MSTIDTIIFDIGGVLIRGASPGMFFRSKNVQYGDKERKFWHQVKVGAISEDEFFYAILKDADLVDAAKADIRKYCLDARPGPAYDLAFKSKEAGYARGIISNHVAPWAYLALETLKLTPAFDNCPILVSDEVRMAKPKKEIYLLALDRLGKPAESCVFLDDKQTNINAAKEIGMYGIVCKDKQQMELELRELGVKV